MLHAVLWSERAVEMFCFRGLLDLVPLLTIRRMETRMVNSKEVAKGADRRAATLIRDAFTPTPETKSRLRDPPPLLGHNRR